MNLLEEISKSLRHAPLIGHRRCPTYNESWSLSICQHQVQVIHRLKGTVEADAYNVKMRDPAVSNMKLLVIFI